jgi:endonuclease YncB( thermonuclease family)
LRGWCSVKIVEIKEFGQDRYGRTLGVVFVNGKNVNLEMVEAGYAEFTGEPMRQALTVLPGGKRK